MQIRSALVTYLIAACALLGPLDLWAGSEPHRADASSGERLLAQVYSPRCATPVGICFVAPQPIGSPCVCGNARGTIIP